MATVGARPQLEDVCQSLQVISSTAVDFPRRQIDCKFFVTLNDRYFGHAMVRVKDRQLRWKFFYPLGSGNRYVQMEQPANSRLGIGALAHSQIVEHLGSQYRLVSVSHFAPNEARIAHLRAMGIIHEPEFIHPFPEYREKSLAYAASRGFTPDKWNPIISLPSK